MIIFTLEMLSGLMSQSRQLISSRVIQSMSIRKSIRLMTVMITEDRQSHGGKSNMLKM